MDERIKSVIEIMDRLETRINTYWNFYTVVVLATIGWLMSSKTPFTAHQAIALTIALSMYFVVNFSLMRAATKRLLAFEDELGLVSRTIEINSSVLKSELSKTSLQYRLFATAALHGVLDAAVLFAIWSKLS